MAIRTAGKFVGHILDQQKAIAVRVRLCSTLITQEDCGTLAVRKLILNNPQRRNVLSLAVLENLHKHLRQCLEDKAVRVVIIASRGPVFSAGHDLKELSADTEMTYHAKVFAKCTEVMTLIQEMPLPVIAQVCGLAAAAGCQLVASCDIVVASENASFSTPGTSVGLFCSTPGVAVSRVVPQKAALLMLLTGQTVSAQDALRMGLLSKVVAANDLDDETMKIATKICSLSKSVTALGKSFFYSQIGMATRNAYRIGERVMTENLQLHDGQEGIKAFVEKRTPVWNHAAGPETASQT